MQKASVAALSLVSALGLAGFLPIGCGTGPADGLFEEEGPPGTGATGGDGGKGGASGSTTGTGGAGGIGVGGSGQSSSSSGNPSSSSSTSGGGGMGSGGMGSGGMGGDGGAGGQPMAGSVPCVNNMMCSLANGGACCWWEQDDSGSCVQAGGSCDTSNNGGRTRIECQTAAQCGAGEKCCGDRDNGNFGTYYTELTCQADCNDITLCDTEGAMGPDCPVINCQGQQQQSVCEQSGLLPPGFLVCGCP